jgi:hypothetical protein
MLGNDQRRIRLALVLTMALPGTLAIEACWRDGRVVTLHNLSAEPATVLLPDDLGERAQAKNQPGPPGPRRRRTRI